MSSEKKRVHQHFNKRAETYNHSANWVTDEVLLQKICALAQIRDGWRILDLATGTGKVAQALKGKNREVIGLDITPDMFDQNESVDELIIGTAHHMPFASDHFDLIVCRQGLQFMDLSLVYPELFRVLKPGGFVVLAHLTSFSNADEEETFLTQRLRNSARVNFFRKTDIPQGLRRLGFQVLKVEDHGSREEAVAWLQNGAVTEEEIEQAIGIYRNSNYEFKRLHQLEFDGSKIFETMNMQLVKAVKPFEP